MHIALNRGSKTLQPASPKNNGSRDWQPPMTLEVAYYVVHSHTNTVLGLCKWRHQYNTKEQQPNSHYIILKQFKKEYNQNLYN